MKQKEISRKEFDKILAEDNNRAADLALHKALQKLVDLGYSDEEITMAVQRGRGKARFPSPKLPWVKV